MLLLELDPDEGEKGIGAEIECRVYCRALADRDITSEICHCEDNDSCHGQERGPKREDRKDDQAANCAKQVGIKIVYIYRTVDEALKPFIESTIPDNHNEYAPDLYLFPVDLVVWTDRQPCERGKGKVCHIVKGFIGHTGTSDPAGYFGHVGSYEQGRPVDRKCGQNIFMSSE